LNYLPYGIGKYIKETTIQNKAKNLRKTTNLPPPKKKPNPPKKLVNFYVSVHDASLV
jgi:hypothetical protein